MADEQPQPVRSGHNNWRHPGARTRTPKKPLADRAGDKLADSAAMPDETTRQALLYWSVRIGDPLFVYFIQADYGGPVKIGKAKDPLTRLSELQCGNPSRLLIRALLLASDDLERDLHAWWRPRAHIRGEWFEAQDTILMLAHDAMYWQMASAIEQQPLHELTAGAARILCDWQYDPRLAA